MKKAAWLAAVMVGLMAAVGLAQADDMIINAAGATFPYPIYSQWAHKYNSMTGLKLNYQSIGSGGGIAQIKAKTVDYGASDAPLKPEALQEAGLVQFPMVMGGVVMVVNLPGIGPGQLKLTNPVLADIYLGKIKKWDDAAIKKLNPQHALAHQIRKPLMRHGIGSTASNGFTGWGKVNEDARGDKLTTGAPALQQGP